MPQKMQAQGAMADPQSTNINNKLDNILSLLSDMNGRIATLENSEKMRDKHLDDKIDKKVQESIKEELDKERRKMNLIVQGIEESQSEIAALRKKHDEDKLAEIMKAIKLEEQPTPTNITRLGSKRDDKPRPMRVTVSTFTEKRAILGNAKLLRESTDFSKAYISPDLTPKEREINSKLVQELKSRRKGGEQNIFISKGKIVTRDGGSSKGEKPKTQ